MHSLWTAPTAWPSTLPVVWMVIPSWAAQSITVLSAYCNHCQNDPGAVGDGLLSGTGGECQEPCTTGASCILHWDTFPAIYHPMKGPATWEEIPGRTFSTETGVDGFMEAASWQELQGPGKSRTKMRVSELPSDCTRQHWSISCGYTVLHGNWLYPLRSVNEKSKERLEEVLWRMSVIWARPVESLLVMTEFDMLKLMICKIFAKSEKVHVLQSEATASSLVASFITCTSSNFLLIHFSPSIIF